jgi:hypothetical protein
VVTGAGFGDIGHIRDPAAIGRLPGVLDSPDRSFPIVTS